MQPARNSGLSIWFLGYKIFESDRAAAFVLLWSEEIDCILRRSAWPMYKKNDEVSNREMLEGMLKEMLEEMLEATLAEQNAEVNI